ncbi:MAG: 3-hydroxyacyl-ACP dehydratase FabZ [Candidatus Parabeggiatoa sp.]|nr:3-hydroxyacyl-ACP dehydratase FabZ [Candidatus Parabeggiatoa sp.]
MTPPLEMPNILERIPHRHPMVMIDRVLSLEPGKRGVGVKCVTYNESFFAGHFPDRPIFPGVLMIEAMAQMAGIVLGKSAEEEKASEPVQENRYLAAVNRLKFTRKVTPGVCLQITVEVLKKFGNLTLVSAKIEENGELVASGELSLSM